MARLFCDGFVFSGQNANAAFLAQWRDRPRIPLMPVVPQRTPCNFLPCGFVLWGWLKDGLATIGIALVVIFNHINGLQYAKLL